jgi:hypothetical protein
MHPKYLMHLMHLMVDTGRAPSSHRAERGRAVAGSAGDADRSEGCSR